LPVTILAMNIAMNKAGKTPVKITDACPM